MSFMKVIFYLVFWFAVATFLPKLLTPIVGEQAANFIYFGLVVLVVGGSMLWDYVSAKQGHKHTKLLPRIDDIPQSLQDLVVDLHSLGFVQVGILEHKRQFKKYLTYVYVNKARNIFAYATSIEGGQVNFSCYLADGFDVSTSFPTGVPSRSKKLIRRIVKSSLQEAFEFHKHHARQHISEHGKPKQFQSLQELLDWEDQQKYYQDVQKSSAKLTGRILIRSLIGAVVSVVVSTIILVPIFVYLILQGQPEPPRMLVGLIVFGSFFLSGLWALKPLYRPETVEERKKKKLA